MTLMTSTIDNVNKITYRLTASIHILLTLLSFHSRFQSLYQEPEHFCNIFSDDHKIKAPILRFTRASCISPKDLTAISQFHYWRPSVLFLNRSDCASPLRGRRGDAMWTRWRCRAWSTGRGSCRCRSCAWRALRSSSRASMTPFRRSTPHPIGQSSRDAPVHRWTATSGTADSSPVLDTTETKINDRTRSNWARDETQKSKWLSSLSFPEWHWGCLPRIFVYHFDFQFLTEPNEPPISWTNETEIPQWNWLDQRSCTRYSSRPIRISWISIKMMQALQLKWLQNHRFCIFSK